VWILTLAVIGIISITCGFVTAQDPDPFDCPYPDLEIKALNYQSPTHTGSEFTFTITVTNKGLATSEETEIQILLPLFVTMTAPVTVPPLQPGESIEITITITIPPEVSNGYGSLQVTINPGNVNPECSYSNNHLSGDLLILPPGMTRKNMIGRQADQHIP